MAMAEPLIRLNRCPAAMRQALSDGADTMTLAVRVGEHINFLRMDSRRVVICMDGGGSAVVRR